MILVVDDSRMLAGLLQDLLEHAGFSACIAFSGEEALEVLAAESGIEAMIVDCELPGINGLETAERAQACRPGIKILLVSGQWPGHRTNTPAQTAVPFLLKPFCLSDLLDKLTELGVALPNNAPVGQPAHLSE